MITFPLLSTNAELSSSQTLYLSNIRFYELQPHRAARLAAVSFSLLGSSLLHSPVNLLSHSKEIHHLVLRTCKPILRLYRQTESVLRRKYLNRFFN